MGRFLMAGFLLRGSDLIRKHLVCGDLSDYYPNYYKYYILELIIINTIIINFHFAVYPCMLLEEQGLGSDVILLKKKKKKKNIPR